jgi:putative tricarboxylic transport membrane protein
MKESKRIDMAGLVVALLLFALAGIIWWDMTNLQLTSVYGVGPKAMPAVIATGLAVLAIGNAVLAFRGGLPERETIDPLAIVLILGGLGGLIGLIALGGGFIPGTAVLFAATSTAFGRRAFFTDLAIGFVLAVAVYLLFAKLLALSLPMGPLEHLI